MPPSTPPAMKFSNITVRTAARTPFRTVMLENFAGWGRRVLLAATVAGTAALLLLPQGASPDRTMPYVALALAGYVGLVVAERHDPRLRPAVVLAGGSGLALLAVVRPPGGSHDLWSYTMYGRILAVHHANPYVAAPSAFGRDPFLGRVSPGWRHARTVYGPAFTVVSAGITRVAGRSA